MNNKIVNCVNAACFLIAVSVKDDVGTILSMSFQKSKVIAYLQVTHTDQHSPIYTAYAQI